MFGLWSVQILVMVRLILKKRRVWHKKGMGNVDGFVFLIVVSTCNAAATDASTTVFNAFSVSATAFCTTVSCNGECYVISIDFSLSILLEFTI